MFGCAHGFEHIFLTQTFALFFEHFDLRLRNRERLTMNGVSIVFEFQVNFLSGLLF